MKHILLRTPLGCLRGVAHLRKSLFHFTILLSVLLGACQPAPKVDAVITFVEDGCTYKGPDSTVKNPITFQYTNTNDHQNYAAGVVTLHEGYGRADLEAHQSAGNPAFADQIIASMRNAPGETDTIEVTLLETGREYFV